MLVPTAQAVQQPPPVTPTGPWHPLRIPLFRNLLIADFVSDVGAFMQSVGAAWLMTSLSSSPLQVALIQTATALPFFLLALPAGSIGDIVDRRKLILATETWMTIVAIALVVATYFHWITPWVLLTLTFALSVGDAIESPSWRAIFPELVPRSDLAPALTLNGIEFNLARAVGPALGGVIVAIAGVTSAFTINALSFIGVIMVISRWKRRVPVSRLPHETFSGATSAAIRYVRYSPSIRKLLIRCGVAAFFSSSYWALLPTLAKSVSSSSLGYGLLLAFFGTGAVVGAVILNTASKRVTAENVVAPATIVFGAVLVAAALTPHLWLLLLVSFIGGSSWTVFLSVFNTLIQRLAADWVRARVLAVYLLVFQGAMTVGSVAWGFAAEHSSLRVAFLIAGAGMALGALLRFPFPLKEPEVALDPWDHWKMPAFRPDALPDPEEGPVMILVEYRIDPARANDFLQAINKFQRIRRRDGAIQWAIFYDTEVPGLYVESFLVDSWVEHERQHARFTRADTHTESTANAFALEPIRTRHLIYAHPDEPTA